MLVFHNLMLYNILHGELQMKDKIKILESKLEVAKDSERISLHNKLCSSYMYRDVEKTHYHGNEALNLSIKHSNDEEHALAKYNMGCYHLLKDEIKVCANYFHQALLLCHEENITIKVNIYARLTAIYAALHGFDKARFYSEKALNLLKDTSHYYELCDTYINIAKLHRYLEEYDIAAYYYNEAKNIATTQKLNTIIPLINMELISNHLRTFDLNVEKKLLGLETYIEDYDDLWFLGPLKILWATYYILFDAYDVACINYTIGLQILEEENQISSLLHAYLNITFALEYKGYHDEAEAIYIRAIEFFEQVNAVMSLPKIYLAMSKFYSNKGEVSLYQTYLRKYVTLKEEIEQSLDHFLLPSNMEETNNLA